MANAKKTFLRAIRAIKAPLFGCLVALFFPLFCSGQIAESFENYNYGDVAGQGTWTLTATSSMEVSNDLPYAGLKSLGTDGRSYIGNLFTFPVAEATGTASFYIYVPETCSGSPFNFQVLKSGYGVGARLSLISDSPYGSCNQSLYCEMYNDMNGASQCVAKSAWHRIDLAWDCGTDRITMTIDEIPYLTNYDMSGTPKPSIYGFDFTYPYSSASTYTFIDNLYATQPSCSSEYPELCTDYILCSAVGGWWHYNWETMEYECGSAPSSGTCTASIFGCQYCDYSECNTTDGCHWGDNFCQFGSGICGTGLDVAFCDAEECLTNGGYWYGDSCNYNPPPILTPWDEYYSEYGDYATSTEWINSIASSTSAFFENIGSFILGFQSFFDITDAYQKGTSLGSAIPTARGYLEIINESMFAGFPVGEFFIFVLGFYLAIGVFRMIRNLFQLIKFW